MHGRMQESENYTKLVGHGRVDKPVSCQDDVGLRSHGLGELEEAAGGLGEALGGDEDGVLEILRQTGEGGAVVQLGRRRERVDKMRHVVEGDC